MAYIDNKCRHSINRLYMVCDEAYICALKNMQLNFRILNSGLLYHDENTLTSSEFADDEDTVMN